MLELPLATYPAPRADLCYLLSEPIRLQRGSCLFLMGDNGAGKTSFLEEIFIPTIRATHDLLYLAQDMDLQQNTIRATLALLDQPVPLALPDLLSAWIRAAASPDVIILDEVDKYFDDNLGEKLVLDRFGWAICVSHLGLRTPFQIFAHGYALHFERAQRADVRLRMELLW